MSVPVSVSVFVRAGFPLRARARVRVIAPVWVFFVHFLFCRRVLPETVRSGGE